MRYFFLIIVLFVTSWANANEEQSTSKSVVVVTITDHDGAAGDVFTSFSHFTGETIQKEGVYLHESLHYIDEEYEGDLMIQLYESIYPNGLFITSFSFGKNDIFEGKTETRANFSVEVKYISKAEMASSPDIYCAAATHTIPLSITQSQSGNIQGEISVSDGNPSTANYTFPVTSEAVSLSVYAIENYYPHLLGKELFVTFTQTYFPDYGTDSYRGLFIVKPLKLTFSSTQPTCSYSTDASITIRDIPYSTEASRIRINLIKYFEDASLPDDYGVNFFDIHEGDTLYWYDQITQIDTIPAGQSSLTIDNSKITDPRFELTSGYYKIEAFYLDSTLSSLCSSDTIIRIEDKEPLELSLTHDTITSSGGQEYHIPVNGETVTIGGSVSGDQGGYSITYEDEHENSEAFTIDNTQLGQGEYTFLAVDDAGCESNLVSLDLDEPNPISLTGDRAYDPKCNENNTTDTEKKTGSINFKVLGGIPNFYARCVNSEKTDSFSIEGFGRDDEQVFDSLSPGLYTLKIWDDGDPERIGKPVYSNINYTISAPDEMTMTASPTDVNCFGGKDGTIKLDVENGTAPFSYILQEDTVNFSSDEDTSAIINNLGSDDYSITIRDKNGCEVSDSNTSVEVPDLELSIAKTDSSSATCELSDGSLTFEVSGGWTDKVYSVKLFRKNDETQTWNETISAGANDKTVTFENLPAGTDYKVTVTNDGECSTTPVDTFIVEKNNPLQEALSLSLSKKESCVNKKDAKILVTGWKDIQGDFSYSVTGNSDINYSSGYISGLTSTKGATVDTVKIHEIDEEGRKCSFTGTENITVIENPVSFSSDSTITDASCSTVSNGSITVKGEGGFGEYQYSFDDGEYGNDSIFDGKESGVYAVSIKDSVGCLVTKEFLVDVLPDPSIGNIVPHKASCLTSKDGSIKLENITHNRGHDFVVEYGETSKPVSSGGNVTFPNIGPGTYDFIISYADVCSYTETVTLGHNSYQPDFDSPEILEEVACSGKNNGRIRLKEKSGINDNYSYHIFENPDFTGDTIAVGSVEGQNIFEINELPESAEAGFGIYILDEKGCGDSLVFKMPKIDTPLQISVTNNKPASCDEISNGELEITASDGFPDENNQYDYYYEKWPNDGGDPQKESLTADVLGLNNLSAGDFLELYVMDKYECRADADPITISRKVDFTRIENVLTTNPACNGDATGLAMPLMQWTPDDADYNYALYSVNQESEDYSEIDADVADEDNFALSGLTSGLYRLRVVDSDGCEDAMNFQLNDPETVSVNVNHNYIRVKGESTGEFSIDIAGGNENYEVGWAALPDGDALDSTIISTDSVYVISGLSAGSYRVAVRDTANCPYFEGNSWFTRDIEIVEPEKLLGIGSEEVFHVSCNKLSDGGLEIEAEGGWGPYTYSLNGGDEQDLGSFSGLNAGDYFILVTDTAGVSFDASYLITEPDTLNIFIDDVRDVTCPLYANGYVEATAINGIDGSMGLHYSIEDVDDGVFIEESFGNRSYGFFSLPRGNYELYVTDDHNCRASKQFTIDEPDTAAISFAYNYIKNKGESTGEILSMVDKGNGVFDYQWYMDDETEPFESGTTFGEIALESLSAGRYTLMVRDTAGCVYENNEWMVRGINLREPEVALAFEINQNRAVSCFGLQDGLIEVTPVGGWGDYTYRLEERNYDTERLFNDLVADEYLITIRDSSGTDYSEPVVVSQPEPLEASLQSIDDVLCFGGNNGVIHLSVTGGNLSYLVSVDGEEWQTGTSIHELPNGDYNPHVKDTLGCSLTLESVNVAQPDEIVLADTTISKSICENNEGSIVASFQGGIGEFQYAWSKDTIIDIEESIVKNIPLEGETDASVFDLYAGRYQVIVTDEHNCDVPFKFFVSDVTDLAIDTVIAREVSCWGYEDGEATASVIKGNAPYYFFWSGDIGSPSGTSATQIPAGEYELMVTDSKGCVANKKFEVGTPDSLYYSTITYEHPLCLGGEKGTIEVEGTGGTPGYSYQWSDGTSASFVNDLSPGVYELTLTDSHDCQSEFVFEMDYQRTLLPDVGPDTTICHYDVLTLNGGDYNRFIWGSETGVFASTRTVTIETPGTYYLEVEDIDNCLGFDTLALKQSILEIESLTNSDVTCYNAKDGEAEIVVNTNKNDYSIVWPDGSGSSRWTNLSGGEYSVEVENPLGCFDQQSFTVAEPEPLSLTSYIMNPLCYGVFNGEVNVSPSGGNGAYQYEWDHDAASGSLNGLDQGTYSVLVRDSKNCTISDIFNLSYTRSLIPDLGSDLVLCNNSGGYLSPGSFYGYRWFFNGEQIDTDSTLLVSEPGNYQVEVSDEDNCLAFDTIQVDQIMSDLSPEFLMATSVPKGDTLMIVDVTNPKPAGLEWHFSGNYEMVEEGDYFCEVVFDEEGIQFVTLSASMGECMGQMQKQILVTPAVESSDLNQNSGTNSSVFSSLDIYPNPTDGAFSVAVELKEEAPLNLYLVRLETGQIFEQSKMTGLKSYSKSYNLSGTGQYVIFAECRGERLMGKVVVF